MERPTSPRLSLLFDLLERLDRLARLESRLRDLRTRLDEARRYRGTARANEIFGRACSEHVGILYAATLAELRDERLRARLRLGSPACLALVAV
ncbi:hypothetical protein [Paludisphaera mucosa]|uniref:Uncharacterized protein n=1 Tax=Paludisphaera mucosa TaxID=3030827 RepID=A0ABT6FEP0_9BACT|nr:hypothetical protein [Paludisphaera mucosa]MDG3006037.1 hypothetical protein [Paludisphaera mucosa]